MKYRNWKWTGLLAFMLLYITLSLIPSALIAQASKVAPGLQEKMAETNGLIKVVAFLSSDEHQLRKAALSQLKDVRRADIHADLLYKAQQQSAAAERFIQRLSEYSDNGYVTNLKQFWIADVISFSATPEVIKKISTDPDLHLLVEDKPLQLIEPVSIAASSDGYSGSPGSIDVSGVRELWNMGYTGRGRLVCSFDTGVEGTHPALTHSWFGVNGGDTTQSWFDPYGSGTPVDKSGHGTHTMGIMVGRDGDDTIGVAFNANWISAAVIDRGQSLSKTISDIIDAFQWAADPDGNPETVDDLPDVVCNSWGIPKGLFEPCDETFWQVIDNLEALGVVVLFACGNEGPDPATIRNPADRASSPTNSFAIGAVDQNQGDLPIASFSSRGPGSCDAADIKPDLVAPGVSIRSSYKGGSYRVISGTSMAAPFIAGSIALMREYNPDATVEEIKNALIQSATDLGSVGKDNDYGFGFVNVAAVLNYLPAPSKPNLVVSDFRIAQSVDGVMLPGNTTELELVVENLLADAFELTAELYSDDDQVTILMDTACFGDIPSRQQGNNFGNPFLVKLAHDSEYGQVVTLSVDFYSSQSGYINTADFQLIIGQPVVAAIGSMTNNHLSYEVSNFGISRKLLDISNSIDPLSQMGLLIADDFGIVYDAFPGNLDYLAAEPILMDVFGSKLRFVSRYRTSDGALSVTQTTDLYNDDGYENMVVLRYDVSRLWALEFPEYSLGMAIDIDFDDGEVLLNDGTDFIFHNSSADSYIGLRLLSGNAAYAYALSGDDFKSGEISDNDKYGLVSSQQTSLSSTFEDVALMVGLSPMVCDPEAGIQFAAVLAIGGSVAEIELALERGEQRFNQATDTDDSDDSKLPESFTIKQNYPNPFNAQTIIEFSLSTPGKFQFEICNTLGQRVKMIQSTASAAGRYTITWDGRDDSGNEVASGVYFYRLTFDGNSSVRKMVLLK